MEDFEPELVQSLVDQCLAPNSPEREYAFEQLARRLGVASQRLYLLDPHLGRLSAPVIASLVQRADFALLEHGARVFYHFCNVRGVAPVAKLLPHEMGCVEPTLLLLARGGWQWETNFVLLVWLGELVLMPIALSRILTDSSRLMDQGKHYLRAPGKPSAAASTLLSRMVSRPDCSMLVVPFVDWCLNGLDGTDADLPLYMVLADVLSTCAREAVAPLAPLLLDRLEAARVLANCSSSLRRKMLLKVVQQAGLICLAPRLAPWRYQRGSRLLMEGVQDPSVAGKSSMSIAGSLPRGDNDNNSNARNQMEQAATWHVPVEVDRAVHLLLEGLRDRDTVVRWSAAKGIGRLSERLPAAFADEVVEAVLELCSPAEEEGAWHGSCLAVRMTRKKKKSSIH